MNKDNDILYHFMVIKQTVVFIDRYQQGMDRIFEAVERGDYHSANKEMEIFCQDLPILKEKNPSVISVQGAVNPFVKELPPSGLKGAALALFQAKRALDEIVNPPEPKKEKKKKASPSN